jgi:hypothetical protein
LKKMNPSSFQRAYKPLGTSMRDRNRSIVTKHQQGDREQLYKTRRFGYEFVPRTSGALASGEMKYFDTENSGTGIAVVTTTWVATTLVDPSTTINLGSAAVANPGCLFAPTVGAALNQRIGRKVFIKKIKVHGTIGCAPQSAQAAADSSCKVRLALVVDQQTNASPMTSAQLYNDAGAATTTLNSFQNPNNFGRFRVLKDKFYCFSNTNMAGSPTTGDLVQAGLRKSFKFTINFQKPIEVHFNATNGGTVADIVDNSLHMVCGCDSNAYAPTIYYYARICYHE